jgi:hypothetical protein
MTVPLLDDGYFVSHCGTTRAWWFGRAFKVDNDPAPAVEVIRNGLRIYPYQPGGVGSSVASFLAGAGPFGAEKELLRRASSTRSTRERTRHLIACTYALTDWAARKLSAACREASSLRSRSSIGCSLVSS